MSVRESPTMPVLALDQGEQTELHSLREALHEEAFERRLFFWSKLVDKLEGADGYTGNEHDFAIAVRGRDWLERFIVRASPSLARKLRSATAPFDDRYRAATRAYEESGDTQPPYDGPPPYPGFPAWWWGRLPLRVDRRTTRERLAARRG